MIDTGPCEPAGRRAAPPDDDLQTDLARRIADLSIREWGHDRATELIGRDSAIVDAQCRLLQFAQADSPLLITGETGTGKELFAKAAALLSKRRDRPFLSVNCAQYQDGQLLAAELFGHKKGSFTGAVSDRPGLFEEADRGTVFLDELGELPPTAQAMLLRVIGDGELVRIGESRARRINVRLFAATARPLEPMIAAGTFREDLYYRLRFLRVTVPALRDRGDDWRILLEWQIRRLNAATGSHKRFSAASLDVLRQYSWPGNVRELRGLADFAFYASRGDVIEPADFAAELAPPRLPLDLHYRTLDGAARVSGDRPDSSSSAAAQTVLLRYRRMRENGETFWTVVHAPFMDRELNRSEVREIVSIGLSEARGSYKRLTGLVGIQSDSYLKFMDFLRHHRLKPL